jgi:PhnB protein
MKINPYLTFDGNTEEAFNFYKSVFGGEFQTLQRFKDTPQAGNIPDKDKDKIMHVALPVGNDNVLMASDEPDSTGQKTVQGSNFSISIHVDSEKEADKVFGGLSAGGKVTLPIAKQFWGSYFGMLTDKFGIKWMVSYDYK